MVVDTTAGVVACSVEAQAMLIGIVAGDTKVVSWVHYHIPSSYYHST